MLHQPDSLLLGGYLGRDKTLVLPAGQGTLLIVVTLLASGGELEGVRGNLPDMSECPCRPPAAG